MTKEITVKKKLLAAVNRRYRKTIDHKGLPKPYQEGMAVFKQAIVDYIYSLYKKSNQKS